jgi:hypothetical protein
MLLYGKAIPKIISCRTTASNYNNTDLPKPISDTFPPPCAFYTPIKPLESPFRKSSGQERSDARTFAMTIISLNFSVYETPLSHKIVNHCVTHRWNPSPPVCQSTPMPNLENPNLLTRLSPMLIGPQMLSSFSRNLSAESCESLIPDGRILNTHK